MFYIKFDIFYLFLNVISFDLVVFEKFDDLVFEGKKFLFFFINRYERKKNLILVLEVLVKLRARLTFRDWDKVYLIVVGGYDERVLENVEYY